MVFRRESSSDILVPGQSFYVSHTGKTGQLFRMVKDVYCMRDACTHHLYNSPYKEIIANYRTVMNIYQM